MIVVVIIDRWMRMRRVEAVEMVMLAGKGSGDRIKEGREIFPRSIILSIVR